MSAPVSRSRTGRFGKVDWNDDAAQEENSIEEDEFEKEMELERDRRADDAQRSMGGAAAASSSGKNWLDLEEKEEAKRKKKKEGSAASAGGNKEDREDKYDPIYFDSDDDEVPEEQVPGRSKKKQTDDELFYDPDQDDEDQLWVDNVRRNYLPGHEPSEASSGSSRDKPKPLPNSDAVLNCPACFAVVCLDCQRHETYPDQYRAMFVLNCNVDQTQKLKFPLSKKAAKKKRSKGGGGGAGSESLGREDADDAEDYNPVKCEACSTEIAVFDKDEVYHFFNIVASHA